MRSALRSCHIWLLVDPVRTVCLVLGLLQLYVITWPDPRLIIGEDSISYLGPAIDAIETGHFTHWEARGFVYPLFLRDLLSMAQEPLAIVYAQRLLVVLTYIAIASSAWLLARCAIQTGLAKSGALTVPVSFWLFVYVAFPHTLLFAHSVMPETLFSLFLSLVLLNVLLVTLPQVSPKWWQVPVVAAVVFGIALIFIKPHWLGAGIVLPFLLIWLTARRPRWACAGWALSSFILALLTFGVPEKLLQQRYDAYYSQVFGPRSLFCNSADLIYEDLGRQAGDPFIDQLRQLLGNMLSQPERAQANIEGWSSLGFIGDRCMYGPPGQLVAAKYAGNGAAESAYYWRAYLGATLRHPDYIVKRLGRQFLVLVARPFGKANTSLRADIIVIAREAEKRPFYHVWLTRYRGDLIGDVESPLGRQQLAIKIFYFIAGSLLILSVALAAWRYVVNRDRITQTSPLNSAFLALLLLFLAINLLIAVVHTFDQHRYIAMQAPLLVLLGLLASISFLLHRTTVLPPRENPPTAR